MGTRPGNSLGTWAFGPFDTRKGVLKLYLGLRLVFILASLLAQLAFTRSWLPFPGVSSDAASGLWTALSLFTAWSVVLLAILIPALRSEKLARADRLILLSLIPDTAALYLAASATGGIESPIYHSVYFLIAVHAYHLGSPGTEEAEPSQISLGKRYVLSSILPSFLASLLLYLTLSGLALGNLTAWFEIGLQLVTATSFSWLGFRDHVRSRSLAVRESDLENKNASLEKSQQDLATARARQEEAERQREATRGQQERMLEALGRVINIAEVRDASRLNEALDKLVERIGQTLEAEYCAIGFVHDATLEDVARWTSFPLTLEARALLDAARIVPIEGSFIGSIVRDRKETLIWNETDGDPLDPNNPAREEKGIPIYEAAADSYRKVLPGGRVRHMLLVPFFSQDAQSRPLGYIHLINRNATSLDAEHTDFSKQQAKRLETIAALLAIAIDNYRKQVLALEESEDARFLSSIEPDDPKIDPFARQLTFLNERLQSRVASLWLPVVDGFDPSPETRKMLLRTVVVSGERQGKLDNSALELALRANGQVLQSESYVGRLLAAQPNYKLHHETNLAVHPHCWEHYLSEIGTAQLLVVPIQDPLAAADRAAAPEDALLAVLCLRPLREDFQPTPAHRDRIARHAQFIQQVILERRLKRQFRQIEQLRQGLDTVRVDDQAAFYRGLVDLVREVMGAEACSLFLTARAPSKLELKASTAARATLEDEAGKRTTVDTESLLGQALYDSDDENFTSATFRRRKAALVCDTNSMPLSRRHFLEVVPTENHRSLLAAPLIGSNSELHGVLRCVNLQESQRLASGFLLSDLRFFSLVASVLARFIEIAQLASRRRRFMREVAHEFATPLLQAETNAAFLQRLLEGRQSTRDPRTIVESLKGNINHLQAQVRNMQYHVRGSVDFEALFNFSAPVDVHNLIEQIRKPMLSLSRASKGIEVYGETADLPALYLDRERMAQVIYNLLQNAVKYSPLGSKPIRIYYDRVAERIKGSTSREWHRIRVSNFGIGVPHGERESIFEEYRRGSNTQHVRQGQSGAGLGLTIARRIVEGHGGVLRLERNDNPTVFAVLLPSSLEREAPQK